jgi:hypothetical protein
MSEYLFQVVAAISQLINALLGGWADELLSSRAYRNREIPLWGFVRRVIDCIFWWEPDHCYQSYRSEVQRLQSPHEHRTLKIYQECKSRDPVC